MAGSTDARTRYDTLARDLARHDRLYYVDAQPEITDRAYDALMAELLALERAHPDWVTPDSPSQRVGGAPIEGFATVVHDVPMLSIENTYDAAGITEWDARVRRLLDGEAVAYVCEPKVDGVAIALHYAHGRLVRGVTRGDGRTGDDVTVNLRTVRAIPLRLADTPPPPAWLEVRGELFLTWTEFERINAERASQGEPLFANPRNSTAGTLKRHDPAVVAKRRFRFVAHGLGRIEGTVPATHAGLLDAFRGWGIPVSERVTRAPDVAGVQAAIAAFADLRGGLDYPVDGMVVKVDDRGQRERCGTTAKAPRGVIAYKYAAEQAVTRLLEVRLQVGKSGAVTPVAVLEPVQLAGTTVSRASLHNFDEVARKDIRVGDAVVVQKAGEIIPYVLRALPESRTGTERPIPPPERCPRCETPLVREGEQIAWRCPNPQCIGALAARLRHFAGRDQMDIEGLGPKLIAQLVETGCVTTPADLYRLTAAELVPLERMGETAATHLVSAIAASRQRGLARLLAALGIRHVGGRAATVIAERLGSRDALQAATVETFTAIPGVGAEIAGTLVAWLASPAGRAELDALARAGVRLTEERPAAATTGPLAGRTLVVTGTLTGFARHEAHAAIVAAGGRVGDTITRKTDWLVAGEKPGSKVEKARGLDVKIVDEAGFRALLEGREPPAPVAPARSAG